MLECILIVRNVVIIIIRIGEEIIIHRKYILAAQVRGGQSDLVRIADFEHFLRIVIQVLADLIAEIGVRILIAYHLQGVIHTYRPVIGRNDNPVAFPGYTLEEFQRAGMLEPGTRQAAISRFALGQFAAK